ncbi:MAG TPA: squalene/phytoene synthase family protein, partial [Devosia sp.]|nr:squalene/phytoene synthase family protein [Devosia sp.]
AGETTSTLYQLAAMILNGGELIETGDAAGHLGVAHALIGHLRAFGYTAAQGRIMLPWSIFVANGVREREIFSGTQSEGLHAALGQVTDLAREHLAKAEAAIVSVPPALRPAFAPITVLKAQFALLDKRVNPFEPAPDDADWRKLMRLAWWVFRNR